jgi:predicted DNA-binding helix-hairpin-helix protein
MNKKNIWAMETEELMSLPGIGAKGADKILEIREAKGDLELERPKSGAIPQANPTAN